ncbi:hypothetical protein TNCV_2595061 [Trichonephila clavipes]|nr:hypothetical protein TNCV_2595061 [Trichonephila clavipes]
MEKPDVRCKELIPVKLTCKSTSIEHIKASVYPFAMMPARNIRPLRSLWWSFRQFRGPISTPGLSPDENMSRIAV